MSKPDLTKRGTPRKVKPGGGRKPSGRTAHLAVRIKPEAKESYQAHAARNDISLAEAVEEGARRLQPGGADSPDEGPAIIIITGARRRR